MPNGAVNNFTLLLRSLWSSFQVAYRDFIVMTELGHSILHSSYTSDW